MTADTPLDLGPPANDSMLLLFYFLYASLVDGLFYLISGDMCLPAVVLNPLSLFSLNRIAAAESSVFDLALSP